MIAALWALMAPGAALAQTKPQFVYVSGGSSIYAYQLDPATGGMTPVAGSPFNEGLSIAAMAVNPGGTFLFAANAGGYNNVSVFSINQTTGALTQVPNSPFSTGLGVNPNVAAVEPSGRFLYVGNQYGTQFPCSGELDSYSIDPTTGELTPTPYSTPPYQGAMGPLNPVGVYVHPNGRWIYFMGGWNDVNAACPPPEQPTSNEVSELSIDPSTGDLGGLGSYTSYDDFPHGLAGDPAGQFLYHEFGNSCVYIESLSISPIDGSLSLNSTWSASSPGQLCSSGDGLAIDSTGKFLYSNIAFFSLSNGTMTPIETASGQGENLLPGLILTDPIGPVLVAGSLTAGTQSYLVNTSTGELTAATQPSYLNFPLVITGYPPQNPLPGAQYSPAGLTFTNSTIGVTSAPQTIELANTGTATLNISSISLTGANASDFSQTNTCQPSLTLAPGANCVFTVTYTPSTTSAESAEISVSDNATGSPHTATLTATGFVPTPPDATVNPNSLSFLQTAIGSSSSMSFTISNSGTETLTISAFAFSGSNPSEFSQTNNCSGNVAGGASCAVTVTFQPQATGQRTATLVVTSNSSSGPENISLSGYGTTVSDPVTVAVSGSGSATVQPNQQATYTVGVTPAAAYSGTIKISCAVAPAGPACSTSPSSVQATVSNNPTTTPITVTVTPSGTAALARQHAWYALTASGGSGFAGLIAARLTLFLFGLALVSWLLRLSGLDAALQFRKVNLTTGALIAALGICGAMAACGGSSGMTQPPPPQNYTVTVTATAGTNTQTVNLTLTVQ